MERERNSNSSESENGEGDIPDESISDEFEISRPNSRTRTSSEEELTLLSENADPNVQDPHERNSMFWPPRTPSENSTSRVRGTTNGVYTIPPRRVRQNRPWTSRERYFNGISMNQQLPYLYYRQYLRQEILRSYMSPAHRLPVPAQFLTRSHPTTQGVLPPLFTGCAPAATNRPVVHIRRRFVMTRDNFRDDSSSASSNSSNSNNSSPVPIMSSQSSPNGVAIVEHYNFIGMEETDIQNNTCLLTKEDETDDDMTCVICMSLTTKLELIRKLPCRHIFHKECIDKWLGFNGICPTCRRDVRHRIQTTPSASR